MGLVSSKGFFEIQATIECGFTLKCICDMAKTYRQLKTKRFCSIARANKE